MVATGEKNGNTEESDDHFLSLAIFLGNFVLIPPLQPEKVDLIR